MFSLENTHNSETWNWGFSENACAAAPAPCSGHARHCRTHARSLVSHVGMPWPQRGGVHCISAAGAPAAWGKMQRRAARLNAFDGTRRWSWREKHGVSVKNGEHDIQQGHAMKQALNARSSLCAGNVPACCHTPGASVKCVHVAPASRGVVMWARCDGHHLRERCSCEIMQWCMVLPLLLHQWIVMESC